MSIEPNLPFPVEVITRRPGDAASLVADNRQARAILGWVPDRSLEDIVQTAWQWHRAEFGRMEVAGKLARPSL